MAEQINDGMKVFLVYVTAADETEARRIARALVEERLAACANILGPIESVYRWDGELCEGRETALILKTADARRNALVDRIKDLHSYDCPCIVCMAIDGGNVDFMNWIRQESAAPRDNS